MTIAKLASAALVALVASNAQAEVFINTFVGTTMQNPQGGSVACSPSVSSCSTSPSVILNGQNQITWSSITKGDSSTYSWGSGQQAAGTLRVYSLADGAGETGVVQGLNVLGNWYTLGDLTETAAGAHYTPNQVQTFAISAPISQVRVVSFSDAGSSAGYDLAGISYDSVSTTPIAAVPEPTTYASMALGLLVMSSLLRRRR